MMMHQRKKPPPHGLGLLGWGASKSADAGQFTQTFQFKTVQNNKLYVYANQKWLAITRAVFCWRFYFEQYRSGRWFCQAGSLLGMPMVATEMRLSFTHRIMMSFCFV